MSEVFKKIAPHVISKNFYGVPVEGSEVQSLGTETKVPDYIKKEEKKEPEFGFYGTANLVSDVLKSKIRGIEPNSTSNKEISRFVFKATTGVPDILTDVATGALELSSSPKIKQKAEALESSKIKLFGKVADTLASQFGVPSEEIADKETGLVKPYESLEGHALDFATLFAGGIGSYKVLEKTKLFSKTPKDIRTTIATSKDPMNRFIGDYIIKPQNKFTVAAKNFIKDLTRGEIAFAPAAQILFDPNETLATALKNSEYLDKDNIIAPLVNYLAADEDDSELKKRAKMLLQDGAIATGLQTAFKILGFSVSFLNQTSNQLFNKSVDSLTTLEEDKLISQILPEMKKTIDSSREIPSVVKEDTEKAVKQITKQAFTTNTSVLEAAPTLLYRTKQRWLTINGFYTPKINDAYQANRRNVRAGGNKAYNAAIKLENNINSYINNSVADPITTKGLVPEGTKALTKLESVTEALKINLDKIKVPLDERAGYLVNRFNLSEDVAESILESRKLIDDLSTEFLKLNQVRFITETSMDSSKELMREIILKDIGSYVNRSYKLYTQGSWTPPTKVVQDAEKYFVEEWLRTKGKGISYENTSQDMKDAAARYAKIQIDKVLGKNKKAFNQSTSNAQKVNESILKERQVLPPEIRALMGEIESPAVNVLQTTSKLVDLVESSRFFNAVADLGAGGQPRYPALWDEATDVVRSTIKATVNYEKMTELAYKGVAIDPKEALKGIGVRVQDVFKDSYAVIQFDEFNKIGEVLGKVKKGDNAGKYRVKTRSATGEDEIIYALPKDLEIVVNDKILRGLTELEYEKIIDKSPFIQQGKLITSKDRYYTEGKYIFREKDYAPKGFETPITNTGSFLDQGYYTTPELAKSLEGMHNTFLFSRYLHDHPVVNSWRYAKTITQKNKTVFDPTTQMRNFGGGAQMYTANGWVPWKNGRIAGSIVKNQLSDVRSEQWNTMYTYFQKEGIANTQLASAEWEALMKNADGKTMPEFTMWFTEKVGNLINKSGIELKGNQIDSKWIAKENKFPEQVRNDPLDMPQKVYAEVDNFFKMSMWFSELNTLQKAFPNTPLKELMDDASKLVRNQLPNYDSGVPAGFKSLKDTPVGNFVSYTPEIIRTSANILERSVVEMTSGNPVLMKRGVARLSGFSLIKGGWLGASAYGYTQMNVTKDQNEAMQTLLEAPWSKRRNKIIGRAGDSFYYIDPTYLNPYDYFSGAANAVLSAYHEGEFNGDSARQQVQDAIVNSVSEGLRFAHEEAIGLKAYKDFTYAYANEKGVTPEGRSVFRDIESRTPDTTLVDAMEFLAYTIGPGFLSDARDMSRAVKGTPNPTTGEVKQAKFKMGEFLTGVSIKEINFDAILQRKAGAYSSAINFDLPSVSRKIVNKKEIDAEAERFGNAYMKQQASKFEADQQFYRQLKAFKQLPGYNEYKIADILEERRARISKDQLFTLFDGKFKATTLSEDKLKAAKEVFGEYHEVFTILDRYRESINGTSLSPLDENKEREGDTKRQIQSIKKGQPKFEYFRESTYAKMKKRMINPDTGRIIGFATGGVVDVPNAPDEPDERIDKLTGLPYNAQAGEAYMDKEDPLRRLGFASGGEVDPLARLGFGFGSLATLGGQVIQALRKNKQTLMVKPHGDNAGFVDVATKENVTGEVFSDISISGLEGKKGIIVNDSISVPSKAQLALKNLQVEGKTGSMLSDETGKVLYNTGAMKGSEKVNKFVNKSGGEGTRYKANLYKRRLWDWDKDIAPEGMTSASNDSLIAITGKGSKHHFALNSNFKEGAKLSYFPDKKSPQYQTVTIGDMELGNIVGYMRPKSHPLKKDGTDNLHPVYDNITIKTGRLKEFDGGKIKEFGGTLLNALKNIFKKESSTLAPLKNIDAVVTKDPSDIQIKQQGGRFSADYDGRNLEMSKEIQNKIDRKFATEIVEANKNIPFINRMVDSNNPNYEKAITIKEGKETHRMANRGNFAYPTIFINPETNKLEKLTEDAAFERAMQTGEFIEFDNDKQAAWFATNNYKKAQQVQDYFKSKEPEIVKENKSKVLSILYNNLGNIKLNSANNWDGQTNTGSTKDIFARFETPQLGVRAAKRVAQANLNATNSYAEYVNRYASELAERKNYEATKQLKPHIYNYAERLAKSQGVDTAQKNWLDQKPINVDMFKWLKATAQSEGGAEALNYFTDDIINEGILLD